MLLLQNSVQAERAHLSEASHPAEGSAVLIRPISASRHTVMLILSPLAQLGVAHYMQRVHGGARFGPKQREESTHSALHARHWSLAQALLYILSNPNDQEDRKHETDSHLW